MKYSTNSLKNLFIEKSILAFFKSNKIHFYYRIN